MELQIYADFIKLFNILEQLKKGKMMFSFKQQLFCIILLLMKTGYAFSAGSCTKDPTALKVQVSEIWKLPVQSRHIIQNVIVSHETENDTFLSGFTLNSNETPHYIGDHFKNRVKPTRSQQGKAVDFFISDATAADGGMYSVHVSSIHDTSTNCYKLFVMDRPSTPVISPRSKSLKVKEGGSARFTCTSNSTTTPTNPDWRLQHRFIVNGINVTEHADEARIFASGKVLVVTDISEADRHLNITCIVWEEVGLTSYITERFTLNMKEEIKYDYTDQTIHIEHRQLPEQHAVTDCVCDNNNTALIVLTVILSIVAVILIIIVVILRRRLTRGL